MDQSPDPTLVHWDPSQDTSCEEEQLNAKHEQRRHLFKIRDRLQRAVISGGHFNIYERMEDRASPYSPTGMLKHRVLNAEDSVAAAQAAQSGKVPPMVQPDDISNMKFSSNSATALLLSRQFEALSRKDILLEEKDELNGLMCAYMQTTRWLLQVEQATGQRHLMSQLEDYRKNEEERRSLVAGHVVELENACRRRTEQAADECKSLIDKELHRAFDVLTYGTEGNERHWLDQQESRGRHQLVLDADRGLSRLYGLQMAECQNLIIRSIVKEKLPTDPTSLVEGNTQHTTGGGGQSPAGGESGTPRQGATTAAGDGTTPRGGHSGMGSTPRSGKFHQGGGLHYEEESEGDARSVGRMGNKHQAPSGYEDSDDEEFGSLNYKNCYGWMAKSTGVLVTWQKRFFVFTPAGKLKCGTSHRGPWQVLFTAPQILRVEVDSYHQGSQPPADQYHQYGFYVDIANLEEHRSERMRFCCYSRKDLNNWLTCLRSACDTVYQLEENHSLVRSPLRQRVDSELSRAAVGRNQGTYRQRTRLEDDSYALEVGRKESPRSPRRVRPNYNEMPSEPGWQNKI